MLANLVETDITIVLPIIRFPLFSILIDIYQLSSQNVYLDSIQNF